MIRRYTRVDMGAVWSDRNKFRQWLEVELAATETLAELGVVPPLDAQQLRTRWIPQRGCNDRNRNADECVLARYTADPAAPPRQSEIDLAHRVAMHYKGLFTFNAQLAARAFTIAAQFETRAGRLKDAHFDTLSALAVLHVAPNILDIANSSAGLSMSPPTQTNPGLESPGPAPAAGLGPAI